MIDPRRWWGRAWHGVLDEVGPSGARAVQRGQALARRGAVEDLEVARGRVTAKVTGDRGERVEVAVSGPILADADWERIVGRIASELRFTAALLDGRLPDDLDDVLADIDVQLLPRWSDLTATCTCDDRGLCRHVAAVHTAAGVAIDRDPFLLMRFRGWSERQLLGALRERRGGSEAEGDEFRLDLTNGLRGARGDLEAIALHPAPVEDPAALIRHLGPPPGVDDAAPLADLIERAASAAWRLAAGDGADAADEELLLAELRAQRVASPPALAAALGREPEEVRTELDRLFEAGVVLRTGTGDRARYRAAAAAP